ncbi:MAG: hypothetical protein JW904_02080 [Spirochaetales bacterium]|nr:hypothetical protein [Spirochaetales bacterium]
MNLRVEITGNRSVQEDLFEMLEKKKLSSHYTLITEALGNGNSGPRRGDAIWPEENFVVVIYCDKATAKEIRAIVDSVKEHFPDEGLKMFAVKTEVI